MKSRIVGITYDFVFDSVLIGLFSSKSGHQKVAPLLNFLFTQYIT